MKKDLCPQVPSPPSLDGHYLLFRWIEDPPSWSFCLCVPQPLNHSTQPATLMFLSDCFMFIFFNVCPSLTSLNYACWDSEASTPWLTSSNSPPYFSGLGIPEALRLMPSCSHQTHPFPGLCVHCQIPPLLPDSHLHPSLFHPSTKIAVFKIIHALLFALPLFSSSPCSMHSFITPPSWNLFLPWFLTHWLSVFLLLWSFFPSSS